MSRDFPGGPVVKNSPCNAGDMGLIPSWGTKITHAVCWNQDLAQQVNKRKNKNNIIVSWLTWWSQFWKVDYILKLSNKSLGCILRKKCFLCVCECYGPWRAVCGRGISPVWGCPAWVRMSDVSGLYLSSVIEDLSPTPEGPQISKTTP